MASQTSFYGQVCESCFLANPYNTELLNRRCVNPHRHVGCQTIRVAIDSDNDVLEKIRPLPQIQLPGKRFVLCKDAPRGVCYRGERCTFAHSKTEMRAWNSQLEHPPTTHYHTNGLRYSSQMNQRLPSSEDFPPLSPSSVATPTLLGPTYAKAIRPPPPRHQPQPLVFVRPVVSNLPNRPVRQQFHPRPQHQPMPRVYSPPTVTMPAIPRPPHIVPQSSRVQPRPPPPDPVVPPSSSRDVVRDSLTKDNYKQKFTELLKLEESEHKRVLEEKCNGSYTLVLHQCGAKPPALRLPTNARYRRYGYLDGISGDQVAYATQASQGSVYIVAPNEVIVCKADILRDNYSHTEEKLYVAFEAQEEAKLCHHFSVISRGVVPIRGVSVRFLLKHSYFNNLKSCVAKIGPSIIQKIVPSPRTFRCKPIDISIDLSSLETSPDQLDALEAILSCSPEGPPNIIVGPFGTGKTRLLAMAASCFFTLARARGQSARILVCTQQWESVNNFYEHYENLMVDTEDVTATILRENPSHSSASDGFTCNYKSIQSFLYGLRSTQAQQNHLVMSTCLNVRELVRDLRDTFFTHILIDEGAQMREPEAISPLSLAHPGSTKVVIAGDQHQVGPGMLVFGEVPSSCGLGVSLLERLYLAYKRLRQEPYISTLVTNYRSHPSIFELPSSLFYDTPLIAPRDQAPPTLHPSYNYPLVFLCSSLDQELTQVDSNVNTEEASVLLDEVNKFARSWPSGPWGPVDLSQTCIMSGSRPQLTTINKLISEKRLSGRLRAIKRLPTYDMQGREFRALFLSTSEPTYSDGSTRNPTKSLCDRHIFNTALTRAKSLVVAVGNPFLLLRTEQAMLEKYGDKGKVWSQYLKRCFENNSFLIPPSMKVKKKKIIVDALKAIVSERTTEEITDVPEVSQTKEEDFPALPTTSSVTLDHEQPPLPITQAPSHYEEGRTGSENHLLSPIVPQSFDLKDMFPALFKSTVSDDPSPSPLHEAPPTDHTPFPNSHTDAVSYFPQVYDNPPTLRSDDQTQISPPNPPALDTWEDFSALPSTSAVVTDSNTGPPLVDAPQASNVVPPVIDSLEVSNVVPPGSGGLAERGSSELDREVEVCMRYGPSSGEWSGGEMRVSPEPEDYSPSGHPLNQSLGRVSISDDTNRRTPTPPPHSTQWTPTPLTHSTQWTPTPPPHSTPPPPPLNTAALPDTAWKGTMVASALSTHTSLGGPLCRLTDCQLVEVLSSGGLGVVLHVRHNSEEYALNILPLSDDVQSSAVLTEVEQLVELRHPNIVHHYTAWLESCPDQWETVEIWTALRSSLAREGVSPRGSTTFLLVQTELCARYTLHTWLQDNCREGSRKKTKVLDFFKQMLDGLNYIHQRELVHRNITTFSVLFSRDKKRLKIGGFGLTSMESTLPTGGAEGSMGDTVLYQSREAHQWSRHTGREWDMFALGIILFEMYYFTKTDSLRHQVLTALRIQCKFPDSFTERVPDPLVGVVRLLVGQDWFKRQAQEGMKKLKSQLRALEKKVKKKSKNDNIQFF